MRCPEYLFWVDVETTGDDESVHHMLEIAYQLTRFDYPFEPVTSVVSWLLSSPGRTQLLDGRCSEFITQMHDRNGLASDLKKSSRIFSMASVEEELLTASTHWPGVGISEEDMLGMTDDERADVRYGRVVMAGNSVDFDRKFMKRAFPDFTRRLSHRVFDVSSQGLACRALGMPHFEKATTKHRAADDLLWAQDLARMIGRWIRPELKAPGTSVTVRGWTGG